MIRLFFLLTLPLYLLDQATKWLVLWRLKDAYVDEIPLIPHFFTLVHWRNTGAAFSFMRDSNGFFMALSALAVLVLIIMARRGAFRSRAGGIGWALLLAGVLGNLTDRILHGSVVDFLLFNLHIPFANPWPAFNVADACICVAAGLFIWQAWREKDSKDGKDQNDA